jgi:hypothetical protein
MLLLVSNGGQPVSVAVDEFDVVALSALDAAEGDGAAVEGEPSWL